MSVNSAGSPAGNRTNKYFLRVIPLLLVLIVATYFLVRGIVLTGAEQAASDADRFLRRGQVQRAKDRLSTVLFFDKKNPHAQLVMAKCLKLEGSLGEAILTLTQLFPDTPVAEDAGLQLALTLLEDQQLEKAEHVLEEYLSHFPDSHVAAEELRWLYFNQFRAREVQRLLEERIQRVNGPIDNLIHLMMTEFRPPVPREGVGYLTRVNEAQPGQVPVMRALAYCRWQLGEFNEARILYEEILKKRPEDYLTLLEVVAMALEHNQMTVAQGGLRRISENERLELDDRVDWFRSLIEERNGEIQASLESVRRAIEKRPYQLRYHYHRATLLQRMNQKDEAEAAFQHARRLEAVERQQAEIVLSGALQALDPSLCAEIADCYQQRGRSKIAARWHELANQLLRGEL